MATYYVRPDGNNANAGTGPATNQAWQTIDKALGASGIASGDTVYIAPGSYNESVTIGMVSATATTSVIGDPTASQFTGLAAGPVYWTVYTAIGASPTLTSIIATSKNYLSFQNIYFDGGTVQFTTSTNTSFINCQFTNTSISVSYFMVTLSSPVSTALAATFSKCTFIGGYYGIQTIGRNVADTTTVTDCLFLGQTGGGIQNINCQTTFFNNTFFCCENAGIDNQGGNASFKSNASNCLFYNGGSTIYSDTSNVFTQTYNRFVANTANTFNVPTSVTTTTTFSHGLVLPYHLQNSLGTFQMFSSILGGPNTSAGIATGAPVSDMYGVTWTGTSPDAGSATYRSLSNVTPYVPTERNASTIRISPGSTSQSIELYLGATGLTSSTSGLTARYNRTRTASVNIPLVARTIAQAWTSGGFAEVDATNMPGVYRLDIPDAALAGGADDVTIVVRGASGTNGAVMTVTLSTGDNTGAGDVGGNIIEITEDPQEVINISGWVNDWHTYVVRLVDDNGTPYDITNDTLSVTYTNVATGSAYSFVSGTAAITKQMNAQGIISILNPAAYPTPAIIRITISATIGSTVRRFGPLEIEVLAP